MVLEAEALFYRDVRRSREIVIAEMTVDPGDVGIISNNGAIEAMGIVDIDNNKSTVRVKKPDKVKGRLFDMDDDEGVEVDLKKEVVLTHGQELNLYKRTRRGVREIVMWFESSEDYFQEEIPNPGSRVPLLV